MKKVIKKEDTKKRYLFYDLETSFNVVWSWSLGNRISLGPDNLISERKIICVCYKFSDDDKVYSIKWDKGDDKKLCQQFAKIYESADFTVAHNGDNFDSKFLFSRCIANGIHINSTPKKIDTLKIAKRLFRFNSNKLDYLGKFLGLGQKRDTGGLKTWLDIIMNNSTSAMNTMVDYCKQDVVLLEKIYNKLNKYLVKK